ncbi:hypothetical protein, partial [Bradyrhizobium sp. CCBAU 45389]|uniref:hypothetical protein n=1 Tax=Bradyrhizobium sp. CCBAU 45389 TaxID=858429 RepID=UPI002305ADD6
MIRRRPQEVSLVWTCAQSTWEQQTLLSEEADGLHGTFDPLKGVEHETDGILHLGVRIEAEGPIIPVNQADWRAHLELATSRLVELATAH